jgi:glucosyl-3-phosphoglycerate synthase
MREGPFLDFDQKKFAKIHDFSMDFDFMSSRLRSLQEKFPSGLIIPVIGRDIKSPALAKIVDELNKCDYLKKVFIALSAESQEDYEEALKICRNFKIPCEVVWCNKPEVSAVLEELKKKGLDVTKLSGKGKDLWITMGIASLDLYAFVVHDADIAYYSKMMPTKMLYPVIEPKLDFFFAKGYYARVNLESKKMYGRICRLFISPLLETLQEKIVHHSRFLTYLQSFSYPLSGEFTIYSDLATHLRIPCDWGFEVGLLAELFRNASYRRICEVDLGLYEHKHKEVIAEGLLRTAEDSFITLLRTLTEMEGIEVSLPFLRSLQVMYKRAAQDKIRQYHADATCNELDFDRHEEESGVDALSEIVLSGGRKFLANPGRAQLPDWLRTTAAMPNIRERLRETAIET